jgi:hypothetical protein
MPKKNREKDKRTSVRVGDISDISGNVNVAGGNISTHVTTGMSAAEIGQLFDRLYAEIDARTKISAASREDIKAEVKDIQTTVTEASQKKGKVEESFVARRFRNIARMAPELLDVIVATLANPLAGLGIAATKIAEKAREESK